MTCTYSFIYLFICLVSVVAVARWIIFSWSHYVTSEVTVPLCPAALSHNLKVNIPSTNWWKWARVHFSGRFLCWNYSFITNVLCVWFFVPGGHLSFWSNALMGREWGCGAAVERVGLRLWIRCRLNLILPTFVDVNATSDAFFFHLFWTSHAC